MKLWLFGVFFVISVSNSQVPTQCTDCSCEKPVVDCRNVCDVCDCDGTTIDCRSKKLRSSFSSDVSRWPTNGTYANLLLDDNLIGRVVPFPPLNLTHISLRGNLLEGIDAKTFYNLPLLEDLDLSQNQFTAKILVSEVFEGPYSPELYEPLGIRSLNLSFNELDDLDQNLFEHLPYLQRLILNGNPLADEHGELKRNTVVAIAGSAPGLQLLDLSRTGIIDLPHTMLKNLPDLRELVLSKNKITQLPAEALSYAHNLQILNLNYNPILVFSSERRFPPITSLIELHISHMPVLKRIESKALSALTSLKYLSCYNNHLLEHISEDSLSPYNMTKLELQDNSLHYLPDKLIMRWDLLKFVDVRGNQWSCDCENQWMVTTLVPILKANADGLMCSQPEPMKGSAMKKLFERNYQMRCLDYYGNRPERDASFLVATFVIVIIVLVLIGAILVYKRGRCRQGRQIDYTAIYQQHVRDEPDNKF